jgi:hypothetical protein
VTAIVEPDTGRGIHRAWWVAAITMAALVAAAGFRSSTGALLEPLEAEFGWSRATTSGAVSLNLVVYGLTAPFAAALMERFGVRRVVAAALLLVALGSGLTLVMTSPWQLWLLWGFAVGVGTGSLALVFGAIIANRWFVRHRGVVVGVFSAASSTGQLVFLPAIAQLADGPGWRWAAGLVSVFALLLSPLVWLVMRDRPADAGTTAYGAEDAPPLLPPAPSTESPARVAIRILRESSRSRTFWCPLLVVLDLRLVDQRPDRHPLHPSGPRPRHAADHEREPAGHDRPLRHRRHGRQRVADRPGRQPLPAVHLGIERSSVVFGWVFASHMIGAGIAASFAGWVRQVNGDYFAAWMTAGGLCLGAAALCLLIPRRAETAVTGYAR